MYRTVTYRTFVPAVATMLLPGIFTVLAGCSEMAPMMATAEYEQRPEMTQSLFASDTAVMSNETIDQILSSKVTLPDRAKIVVLNYGPRRVRPWWSEEISQLEMSAVSELTDRLEKCDRVAEASFLPSMLAPVDQSIPHFRETAARCQAELFLLYRSTHEVYRKHQVLKRDQVKSYCLVEAVLIDTRTGIVPFTTAVMHDYEARKESSDLNLSETIRKAELRATGQALAQVAEELTVFLEKVPRRGAPQASAYE